MHKQWQKHQDEDRVAAELGHDNDGNSRDLDGLHGKNSKQFATTLTNTADMTFDDIIALNKQSFKRIVDAVTQNIDTYTMPADAVRFNKNITCTKQWYAKSQHCIYFSFCFSLFFFLLAPLFCLAFTNY